MTAIITCSIENKTFESHFPIDRETPEYMIADEAYRLAILFAQTQFIANSVELFLDMILANFSKILIMIIKSKKRHLKTLLTNKELP